MIVTCRRCGYEWEPREGNDPKACPSCKSYQWKTEVNPVYQWRTEAKANAEKKD